MRIGIDARLYFETGVGRYIRNLIDQLKRIDTQNSYVVFLNENAFDQFETPKNWEKRKVDIAWHSVSEQAALIPILLKEKLDLVHFPYFSYPMLYPGKFVVTIHDMIVSHFDTGRASTHHKFMYQIKRFGYELNHHIGLRRAERIIAVSESTKREINATVGIHESKISVIYEGVDSHLLKLKSSSKSLIETPYLLYIGNAYPHKNVDILVDAFEKCVEKEKNLRLVLVGPDDVFYSRLKNRVEKSAIKNRVRFFGPATDAQLVTLYVHAKVLVSPSLMEGFGLPIIEALHLGTPVIASNISVYCELFEGLVNFFDPQSVESLSMLCTQKLAKPDSEKVAQLLQKFSWEKAARQTLEIYSKIQIA